MKCLYKSLLFVGSCPRTKQRILIVALGAVVSTLPVFGAGYTLFGGATIVSPGNNSLNAVQLTSNLANVDPNDDFSGIDFGIPAGLTFNQITTLSTDYNFTHNSCGGGAPRFQINMGGKNAFVYIGPPPNYTLCAQNTWLNTGNLALPGNFIDTSQLPGGTFYDTFAHANTLYGTMTVTGIQLVTDAGWFFADKIQTVLVDNVLIDSSLFTFDPVSTAFQVRHFVNTFSAESYVDITNTGASATAVLTNQNPAQNNIDGSICVNMYAFAADEQEIACCSCLVTPNGLYSASVQHALINNGLTPAVPFEAVIKLISTVPNVGSGGVETCNPASISQANSLGITPGALANGLLAWGTTPHGFPTATGPSFQLTETPFLPATLSTAELQRDVQECQFIQILGSGQFGICKGCSNVGLGAAAQ